MCPLFVLVFVLLLVVGLAWSEALRSPQGGAFRAQRKARPTTGAAESELLSALSAAPRGGRPRATGGPLAAPTSAWPSADSDRWPTRPGGCRNLLPRQRAPSILDGQAAVPPFADPHFALRRRLVPALRLELKEPILVTHYPVVADRAFRLQPENAVQLGGAGRAAVVVFPPGRRPRKPPVVFRQICGLQIHVGLF